MLYKVHNAIMRHILNHYYYVNYIFAYRMKLLDLVRSIIFTFSFIECVYVLCFTLVRSVLESAYAVWNSLTFTHSNTLERIQQKFAALHFNSFFLPVHHSYAHAVFLIQVYLGCKFGPSVLETLGRVPARYIRDPFYVPCLLF
jgi:hypothetical protein